MRSHHAFLRATPILVATILLAAASAAEARLTASEFFNTTLKHYFMTAYPGEKTAIDGGAAGPGWTRTGGQFDVFESLAEGPSGTVPICRFYARGPNSHFYTANAGECAGLRDLETQQRAQAQAAGQIFQGWGYEGIAFFAVAKVNGACPVGYVPVFRLYNNRGLQNDSNHRFTTDATARSSLVAAGWADEGIDFCAIGTNTNNSGGGGTPPGGTTGTEECGAFHATTRTLSWVTTTTGIVNKVERTTDRPMGITTVNGQLVNVVRTQAEGGDDYEDNYIQTDAASWRLVGLRSFADGKSSTTVYEPVLSLPMRWNANQVERLVSSARVLETGERFAIDQETVMAGRRTVTLPDGKQVDACIVRIATNQAIDGGMFSMEADCLVAPGYGPVQATTRIRATQNGATIFESTVDKVLVGIQ